MFNLRRLFLLFFVVIFVIGTMLLDDDPECDEIFLPEKRFTNFKWHTNNIPGITNCIQKYSNENLTKSEAEYIWRLIIKIFNGTSNIPNETLSVLRWVIPAINEADYGNLTFTEIGIIENFGLDYNLTYGQLSAIADRVRKDFAAKVPEDYTGYDLKVLRNILCGFNASEIQRIHPSAYKDASYVIGQLKCSSDVMKAFAALAINKEAFGPAENWTDDITEEVGEVKNYLPKKN